MDTPFNFNNLTLLASVATAVATNNYPNALTVGCEPLDRFMYFRFGFAWSPGEPIPHVSTSRELAEMRKILGDTLSPLSETYATSMLQFIGSLVDIGHPPEELWDLTSNVPAYFKAYVPFKGHVQYRNKLGLTVFNGVKYYFLLPLDTTHTASSKRDRSWFLVTQQATAVLESLRRGHTTRLQAATYFLNRGIPFSTRTATSKFETFPSCSTSGRRFAPSFRPAGYKFTKEDFALYNKRLAEFLKEPRARVALLQGGILWRLVKMCQPDYLDNVLEGPVLDSKHKHMFASPDGQQEFWDDVLEESDIEVICGVYQLTTGNSNRQVTRVSWWPQPSAWLKSGLSVGYWSPACESWFQRRLAKIQDGTIELRTSTRWRTSMVLLRKQAKIAQTNEILVAKWIEDNLTCK